MMIDKSMASSVAFRFCPADEKHAGFEAMDAIGFDAYLKQIESDTRPYAEMPQAMLQWAQHEVGKNHDDIMRFLLGCSSVICTITKPVNVDIYKLTWKEQKQ